jgi:hypothetical protein
VEFLHHLATFCVGEFDTLVWQDEDFHGDAFKLALISSISFVRICQIQILFLYNVWPIG